MNNVIELQPKKLLLEWLVFQLSPDPDADQWINVHPEDLPAWVVEEEVVIDMRKGQMVCGDPSKNRLWFRVIKVDPPDETH